MSSGVHCDGPACESWANAYMGNKSGFITVLEGLIPSLDSNVLHFCSWDCLNKYALFRESIMGS